MKKSYAVLALLLLVPTFAISQSTASAAAPVSDDAALTAPVPADQQATNEQLVKMIEVMHLRDQMQSMTEDNAASDSTEFAATVGPVELEIWNKFYARSASGVAKADG